MEEVKSKEEIKENLIKLKGQIDILEWDNKKMQINPYKKAQLEEMRKEYNSLKKELEGPDALS